jgi:hypothetical protein
MRVKSTLRPCVNEKVSLAERGDRRGKRDGYVQDCPREFALKKRQDSQGGNVKHENAGIAYGLTRPVSTIVLCSLCPLMESWSSSGGHELCDSMSVPIKPSHCGLRHRYPARRGRALLTDGAGTRAASSGLRCRLK